MTDYYIGIPPDSASNPAQTIVNKYNNGKPVNIIDVVILLAWMYTLGATLYTTIQNGHKLKTLTKKNITAFITEKDIIQQNDIENILTEMRIVSGCGRVNLGLSHDGVNIDGSTSYKSISVLYESINNKTPSTRDQIQDISSVKFHNEILLHFSAMADEKGDRFLYMDRKNQKEDYQASMDAYGVEAMLSRLIKKGTGDIRVTGVVGILHLEWLVPPEQNPLILKELELNRLFNTLIGTLSRTVEGKKLPDEFYPKPL